MLLPLKLLQFLLYQKLLIGTPQRNNLLTANRLPHDFNSNSKLQKTLKFTNKLRNIITYQSLNVIKNHPPAPANSTALTAFNLNLQSKLHSLTRRLTPVESRQPGEAIWLPIPIVLIIIEGILAIANSIVIGLIIIEQVVVGIVIAVIIKKIIRLIIRIVLRLLRLIFKVSIFKVPIIKGVTLHSLFNGKLGRFLRDLFLRLHHKLRQLGLKKEKLHLFKIFQSDPLDWEHFITDDWSATQIKLARQRLLKLNQDLDTMDRYLDEMTRRYDQEFIKRRMKYCSEQPDSEKCHEWRRKMSTLRLDQRHQLAPDLMPPKLESRSDLSTHHLTSSSSPLSLQPLKALQSKKFIRIKPKQFHRRHIARSNDIHYQSMYKNKKYYLN